MPDFTVHQYGDDTSGRGLFMTAFMHDWWEGVVAELGFRPTVVQGAFMTRNGGGAKASAGYHDQGGCMDVRTRDLTPEQIDALVRVSRSRGGAAWRRDESATHGGMDPHCHITLGADSPLSAGARESWRSYLAGCNGLANNAPDYEWRPTPLVTTPPEDDMTPEQDARLKRVEKMLTNQAKLTKKRLQDIADSLADNATQGQIKNVRRDIAELAASISDDEA